MIYLFSFIFLGVLIVWVYSLTVDWTINRRNILRRAIKLFGYSILVGVIALILDSFFTRY